MIAKGHITTLIDRAGFDCGRVITFTVAGVKPCLGLVLETVLIPRDIFGTDAPQPTSKGPRGAQGVGR